jgi:hypothetical protein
MMIWDNTVQECDATEDAQGDEADKQNKLCTRSF